MNIVVIQSYNQLIQIKSIYKIFSTYKSTFFFKLFDVFEIIDTLYSNTPETVHLMARFLLNYYY